MAAHAARGADLGELLRRRHRRLLPGQGPGAGLRPPVGVDRARGRRAADARCRSSSATTSPARCCRTSSPSWRRSRATGPTATPASSSSPSPTSRPQRNLVQLNIPCLGSAINKDLTCKTAIPGLDLTPKDDRPDMAAGLLGLPGHVPRGPADVRHRLLRHDPAPAPQAVDVQTVPPVPAVDHPGRHPRHPRRLGHRGDRPPAVGRVRPAAHRPTRSPTWRPASSCSPWSASPCSTS